MPSTKRPYKGSITVKGSPDSSSHRASWAEFHRLYRRLVYGRARRAGLPHEDAEDVAQDVFKRVAETIHEFEYFFYRR